LFTLKPNRIYHRSSTYWIDEKSVKELQRKKAVNLRGIVAVALEMVLDNFLNASALQVRPDERAGIQKHFPHIVCKNGPVPPPKMEEFVTPHPKTLQMKRRQSMVNLCNPLRHPVVVGVLGLEGKLQEAAI